MHLLFVAPPVFHNSFLLNFIEYYKNNEFVPGKTCLAGIIRVENYLRLTDEL